MSSHPHVLPTCARLDSAHSNWFVTTSDLRWVPSLGMMTAHFYNVDLPLMPYFPNKRGDWSLLVGTYSHDANLCRVEADHEFQVLDISITAETTAVGVMTISMSLDSRAWMTIQINHNMTADIVMCSLSCLSAVKLDTLKISN